MAATPFNAQYMQALARANEVRSHRAVLKLDIKAGRRSAYATIDARDGMTDSMKVIDVLLAMPHVGRVKANRWLSRCRISPSKTSGGTF
jgi:hypothetical protein